MFAVSKLRGEAFKEFSMSISRKLPVRLLVGFRTSEVHSHSNMMKQAGAARACGLAKVKRGHSGKREESLDNTALCSSNTDSITPSSTSPYMS